MFKEYQCYSGFEHSDSELFFTFNNYFLPSIVYVFLLNALRKFNHDFTIATTCFLRFVYHLHI